ncbi:carbohydrate ABC transporter substrate-binding protein, CUT1 family [Methylobacterium sp. 174MFSha1.1]|uniref:ABC transporter substrate-binding protein n=1 Tax=Methylobacterium sp. 174MFSha1.1 TaxID=1502749 RepID=UPI0008F05059|nr:ABC transporter substrate-binding protein [Methylobacterium sp. 174MFSha1.1]SFU70775.1 carbohydrate ABC transporter substrate-binding protein, CUT1 family [Methylobacterium sp. 174MFSha1.1]
MTTTPHARASTRSRSRTVGRRGPAVALAGLIACLAGAAPAAAEGFDWKRYDGQTINLVLTNHPWGNAVREMAQQFTDKTGIKLRIEILNEDPQRARLNTLLQAKSSDVDVYISLKIREGAVYNKAGWYADVAPMLNDPSQTAPDFKIDDFGAGLIRNETFGGRLTGLPINVEGPLFYWRKDIFAKCNVTVPEYLEDILDAARKIKACDPSINAWAARGVRNAVPYPMAAFVFNMGGGFKSVDGTKPGLCRPESVAGLTLYTDLLKDYGPVGATNHSFPQVVELLGQGKVAMTHESSNEFSNIMKYPGREDDLGIKLLPKGRASGVSQPIGFGWGLSISEYSRRKGPSWYFLQWATSPEMQATLVDRGVAPSRTSVFEGEGMRAWASQKPVRQQWVAAVSEISRRGTGDYASPTDRVPETREIIGRAAQEVVLGQKTPQQAACDADAALLKLQ